MTQDRKTRFHTANGTLCLNPVEISFAFLTTVLRKTVRYHVPIPWLILPALKFIGREIIDKDVFEFGSGTSTFWYADRCRHIVSVEDDARWYGLQMKRMATRRNVQVSFEPDADKYVGKIVECGRAFDVVIVDGSYRLRCLKSSVDCVRLGGCILVDNTDQQTELADFVRDRFPADCVTVMSGYAPGSFYAKETTVIRVS